MKMKIILTIAVLVTTIFFFYGRVKAREAERNAEEAVKQVMLAKSETERAEKMALQAQQSATEAMKAMSQAEMLMEQLVECQNRK